MLTFGTLFSIFIRVGISSYIPAYEDGTDIALKPPIPGSNPEQTSSG
jgi:hypothetical protein